MDRDQLLARISIDPKACFGGPHPLSLSPFGRGGDEEWGSWTRCFSPARGVEHTWRIVYYLDSDAIVILEVFAKKSRETPQEVIETCKARLKRYQDLK